MGVELGSLGNSSTASVSDDPAGLLLKLLLGSYTSSFVPTLNLSIFTRSCFPIPFLAFYFCCHIPSAISRHNTGVRAPR